MLKIEKLKSINSISLKKENLNRLKIVNATLENMYVFEAFLAHGLKISKMASIIYGVSRNKMKGIGYIENEQNSNVHGLIVPKHAICFYCLK